MVREPLSSLLKEQLLGYGWAVMVKTSDGRKQETISHVKVQCFDLDLLLMKMKDVYIYINVTQLPPLLLTDRSHNLTSRHLC